MTKNELSTKIVLKHVHQVLKPLGYKKMGKRFFKYINDIIFLIDVQKTVYGTKDDTSITVNVGIYSRVLAKATFHYESETPPYYICHYHERIGMFTDKKKDKWWDLGTESDAEIAGKEITSILIKRVLPFLDEHTSTKKLYMSLKSGKLSTWYAWYGGYKRNEYIEYLESKGYDKS